MATRAQLEQASQNPYARAFLDMISAAEGTTKFGYYTLVGGTRLSSLAKHPGVTVSIPTKKGVIYSTAAGRYQFLKRTWSDVAAKLGLPDFGPHSQDLAALELIARRGGLNMVLAGNLDSAIAQVRGEWASFPGAGYGQGERSLAFMRSAFANALQGYGGTTPTTTAQTNQPATSGGAGAILGTAMPGLTALQAAQQHPGAMFGSFGTILLLGGAAFAVYYLFFSEDEDYG